ncbi:MAG: SUMF1/EgtB/PvdO family nonheme iron enzyme [Muribaculum sp.]|nr:SUMF1/EgtB/PvdO family nonheme iron enzyme [Muribaculum sp.]
MNQQKYDIFISYRRDGGAQYARILQLMLNQRGYKVFLDYNELTDGKFGDHIQQAIKDARIFMLILSKGALDRCKNEGDWVRREILLAIQEGKHIIPINPDNTFEGIPDGIPEIIREEVGTHQHSEINFGQTLGVTVDYMVTNRIEPQIGKRTRLDDDIDVLNQRLCDEDKARRRHRLFIKLAFVLGIVAAIGIIAAVALSMRAKNNESNKRKHLIEQIESRNPGLNFMANDSISIAQLEVIDQIFRNMRDVYGDSIRFSAFETTVREYHTILGKDYDPAEASLPVNDVSFARACEYIQALNALINADESDFEFTLPTKEEWEYAASDGNSAEEYVFAGSNDITEVAWYEGNSEGERHSADGQTQLKPNKFGLYDMTGNVSEHVYTPYVDSNHPDMTANMMLVKGGNYESNENECSIKSDMPLQTDLSSPKVGFRLVLRKK